MTDNGTNFVKAFKEYGIKIHDEEYLEQKQEEEDNDIVNEDEENFTPIHLESEDCGDITLSFHLRCCSHTLNLVCTTDVKNAFHRIHTGAMGKCSAIWNVSGRPKSAEIIESLLKCQLTLPCVTRWNSLYDSISLLLKHKESLHNLTKHLGLPPFRETEIEYLQEYVTVMSPIAIALDRLQGDKDCLYGVLLPTLLAVDKKLKRLSTESLLYCCATVNALSKGFSDRFRKFLNLEACHETNVAILASVSNPRFKLKWLTINSKFNTTLTKKRVQEMLTNSIKALKRSTLPNMIDDTVDIASGSSADDFFDYELSVSDVTLNNEDSTEMEVLQYFGETQSSLDSLRKFPGVLQVFLKYNTPLPSSAPVERLFSLAGHIHAPKRSRLSDEMFNHLVFLKGNSLQI